MQTMINRKFVLPANFAPVPGNWRWTKDRKSLICNGCQRKITVQKWLNWSIKAEQMHDSHCPVLAQIKASRNNAQPQSNQARTSRR